MSGKNIIFEKSGKMILDHADCDFLHHQILKSRQICGFHHHIITGLFQATRPIANTNNTKLHKKHSHTHTNIYIR